MPGCTALHSVPPTHPPINDTIHTTGVYVPAGQYEEECEERRQLGARVEELEAEAEAVAAQHELDKQDWAAEMKRQAAVHEKELGAVCACQQCRVADGVGGCGWMGHAMQMHELEDQDLAVC